MALGDAELLFLLRDLESDRIERKSSLSDRIERKSSLSDPDEVRKAICAFANDLPNHALAGVIFIGVDNHGNCTNFQITDRDLTTLGGYRSDGRLLPFPVMTVAKRSLGGCEVIVVEVEPAENPPGKLDGRVWIRVGPRKALATPEEERRLIERRRWGNLPFDGQPAHGATIADIDVERFRREYLPSAVAADILKANRRTLDHQLEALRLIDRNGTPTNAAILVLGIDPRRLIPGAYIQFLRFDGCNLVDPVRNQKELSGPVPDVLLGLDELLSINISVASDFTSGSREFRRPDYPMVALQQLTRNAILHRTYESSYAPVRIYWFNDRVEIHSPGGLYGHVNPRNFGSPGATDYRNPLLAEAMKNLGFVQRFGVGISTARAEMARNGNPQVEFNFDDPESVLVIVRSIS